MSQSQPVVPVIQSLEAVRDKVKQRLTKVPEYRAFLAIEKPIAEVADIPDLVAHLQTAKQKILDRLATTQEYQALLTVDKTIKDISEIIYVVGNDTEFDAASAIEPDATAKVQRPVPTIVATAPLGRAPAAEAATTKYSREATEVAAAITGAGQLPEMSISNTAERRSALGHVEEWRLTALDDGKPEAEKVRVA
jgi:hypothetical protein